MSCVVCFQEVILFQGRVCLGCWPEWYTRNKHAVSGGRCVINGCATAKQNTLGMCMKHNLEYWQAGGRSPGNRGRWFNPDGTRMVCSKSDCNQVVSSEGLCKHHYQNEWYESGRGKSKGKKNTKRTGYDGAPIFFPCTFEGCAKPYFGGSWCAGHYYQNLRGEKLEALNAKSSCTVPNCPTQVSSKLNPSRVCARHRGLANRFNLSDVDLVELHLPKNYACENLGCGSTENLHMDHDHGCCPREKGGSRSCGRCVRGWLCRTCNIGLGMLQENPRKIQGLLEYVARF